jgi:hypothetical protein
MQISSRRLAVEFRDLKTSMTTNPGLVLVRSAMKRLVGHVFQLMVSAFLRVKPMVSIDRRPPAALADRDDGAAAQC